MKRETIDKLRAACKALARQPEPVPIIVPFALHADIAREYPEFLDAVAVAFDPGIDMGTAFCRVTFEDGAPRYEMIPVEEFYALVAAQWPADVIVDTPRKLPAR